MTKKIIQTLRVEVYRKGLADCLMLIQRGRDAGLSLEDSVDAAKKAVLKNNQHEEHLEKRSEFLNGLHGNGLSKFRQEGRPMKHTIPYQSIDKIIIELIEYNFKTKFSMFSITINGIVSQSLKLTGETIKKLAEAVQKMESKFNKPDTQKSAGDNR